MHEYQQSRKKGAYRASLSISDSISKCSKCKQGKQRNTYLTRSLFFFFLREGGVMLEKGSLLHIANICCDYDCTDLVISSYYYRQEIVTVYVQPRIPTYTQKRDIQ